MGLIVKAVHVETGVILWTSSMFHQIDGAFSYTSPVEALAIQVSQDIVTQLMEQGL